MFSRFYDRLQQQNRRMEQDETPSQKYRAYINIFLIIVNMAVQQLVTYGVTYTMTLYLTDHTQLTETGAQNVVSIWKIVTSILSLVIAFISDSYVGRFSTIGYGSFSSLLGIFILWSITVFQESKPGEIQSCLSPGEIQGCKSQATTSEIIFLFFSFLFISVGVGCVECSTAFAADQLQISKQQKVLEKFFMFSYASSSIPVTVAFAGAKYTVKEYGWKKSLGTSLIPLFLCVVAFSLASLLYVKEKTKERLLSFVQVLGVAYKNRNMSLPPPNTNTSECSLRSEDSKIVVPSPSLSFLNKACRNWNDEQDIARDGSACSIEQVEELKALIMVSLLWSAGIMLWTDASQDRFMLLQVSSMDRHVSLNFEIPIAAFGAFNVVLMIIWMILYGIVILPLASRIKGEPVQLGIKRRMGIGLLFSWIAMLIAVVVESYRKGKAIQEGNSLNMSAMWLLPQYCLIGISLGFTAVAQAEFLYTELPKHMSSIAMALLGLGPTVASWVSSFIAEAVSNLTSRARGGKETIWSDMNKAPLDKHYLALAVLSFINLFYFLLLSRAYGPCKQRREKNDDM